MNLSPFSHSLFIFSHPGCKDAATMPTHATKNSGNVWDFIFSNPCLFSRKILEKKQKRNKHIKGVFGEFVFSRPNFKGRSRRLRQNPIFGHNFF